VPDEFPDTSSPSIALDPIARARQALENARAIRQNALDATAYRARVEAGIASESAGIETAKSALEAAAADLAAATAARASAEHEAEQGRRRLLQLMSLTRDLLMVVDGAWEGDMPLLGVGGVPLVVALPPAADDNIPASLWKQLHDQHAQHKSREAALAAGLAAGAAPAASANAAAAGGGGGGATTTAPFRRASSAASGGSSAYASMRRQSSTFAAVAGNASQASQASFSAAAAVAAAPPVAPPPAPAPPAVPSIDRLREAHAELLARVEDWARRHPTLVQ
jgi:hypothetical protein